MPCARLLPWYGVWMVIDPSAPRWQFLLALCVGLGFAAAQQPEPAPNLLLQAVRIFDGRSATLSGPTRVLIQGNRIERIDPAATAVTQDTVIIDCGGRVLMPGLIDAHAHIMFAALPPQAMLGSDIGFLNVVAVRTAQDMLLRGFTSVRDLGGPVFGLKRGIDAGIVPGPRIWPSGAFISQTGGHGDFRLPMELPAGPGDFSYGERVGAAAIADGADAVRKRVREQLALGAAQVKVMAGGGVSSNYDPLDVTQYGPEEMRAAVEAAANWGTYVTVHAYTPRSVRQAIAAGVRCIDHGHLLDEETVALMAEQGIWWSLQPFVDEGPTRFAEGTPNRRKQLLVSAGTDRAYLLARKHGVKIAWGTDLLFSPAQAAQQAAQIARMTRWFQPIEVLRMVTSGNAELLALSGERSPYEGKLGVIEPGALADILVLDGDPLADLKVLADAKNLRLILKDGRIYKDTLTVQVPR
jgi:imidazolonepropionase-like amidohydrolase